MKKIIGLSIVLIVSLNLKAQNQIKGKIVEQLEDGTEVPIPGANVYWEGTTIGVSTNIIDASFKALVDSLDYKLFKDNAPASL